MLKKSELALLEQYPSLRIVDLIFAQVFCQKTTTSTFFFLAYLFSCARRGHLCLTLTEKEYCPQYEKGCHSLLLKGWQELPPSFIEKEPSEYTNTRKPLILFENRIYLQKNWYYESSIFTNLLQMEHEIFKPLVPKEEIIQFLRQESLSKEQQEILIKASMSSLFFILGGPGTGKTYIATFYASMMHALTESKILFLAPTGKALFNMKQKLTIKDERISFETIHSYLNFGTNKVIFPKTKSSHQLVIIDEASMIDAKMMTHLLSSKAPNTSYLFLGDPYQLPPVETGSLLPAIKKRFPFCIATLQSNFRFEQKELIHLSSAILHESPNQALTILKGKVLVTDTSILEKTALRFTWDFDGYPDLKILHQKMKEFVILTTLRKGPLGAIGLNRWIRKIVQLKTSPHKWRAFPIIVTKNYKKKELYNGLEGIVVVPPYKQWQDPQNQVHFFQADLTVPQIACPNIELAYVLSVHKSQGSEYEEVLFIVPDGGEHFGKEIIYTGITRAKKKITLLAQEENLHGILSKTMQRETGLSIRR
jgi:exodeoxyribonuclease V alpha subunit